MTRKAAFFDVDGTLTTERVWKGVIEYFAKRKQRRSVYRRFWLKHTPRFLLYKVKLLSQSSFRRSWAADLAWFVAGLTPEEGLAAWDWVAQEYLKPYWRKDALDLIKKHKQAGDLVVLVSAGLTPLEQRIAEKWGADFAVGTDPELRNGRYTGKITGPVCLDEFKAELTKQKLAQHGHDIDLTVSTAYADSATDADLLEMVGRPVAFHPDRDLLPIAKARGWQIVE
jgi:HAD superfamily hydrolase (TIGR01490 family)